MEDFTDSIELHGGAGTGLQPEVVNLHGAGAFGRDFIESFVVDFEAHVFEHGENVGECYGGVGMVDLEQNFVGGDAVVPIKVHA